MEDDPERNCGSLDSLTPSQGESKEYVSPDSFMSFQDESKEDNLQRNYGSLASLIHSQDESKEEDHSLTCLLPFRDGSEKDDQESCYVSLASLMSSQDGRPDTLFRHTRTSFMKKFVNLGGREIVSNDQFTTRYAHR
jgi:hypothetical protein